MDIGPALDTYNGFSNMFYKLTPRKTIGKVHGHLHGAFVNFVKTGDPNGAIDVTWQKYTPDDRFEMSIDVVCSKLKDPISTFNGDGTKEWTDGWGTVVRDENGDGKPDYVSYDSGETWQKTK